MRYMYMQWEPSLTTRELRDTIRGAVQKVWGNVPYTFTQNHDDDSIRIDELPVPTSRTISNTDTSDAEITLLHRYIQEYSS